MTELTASVVATKTGAPQPGSKPGEGFADKGAWGWRVTKGGFTRNAPPMHSPTAPSELPLAVAGTEKDQTAKTAEKIDPMSLVKRARKVLQESIKEGGKMYLVDPLDVKTTADIESTAKGQAATEIGTRPDTEPQDAYDKRLAEAAAKKMPAIIQARQDFKTKHGAFIEGDLGKLDEHGQIVAADGKKTTHNYQVVEALRAANDQTLADEYYQALRMVDPESKEERILTDFQDWHIKAARNKGSTISREALEAEATAIFNRDAIIPDTKAATPQTKAGEAAAKSDEFKPSEALLAEQRELATVALDYLAKFAENEKSPLCQEARKHYVQLYLATKAISIDGNTANPLLECALFSFKKAFIDPPNLKGRVPFVHDPNLNLSRAVVRLENPVGAAILKRFADKKGTFDPNDSAAVTKAQEAAEAEINSEIKAQAKARVDIELAKNPKTKLTQAQAEADIVYEMQKDVLKSAREKCAAYFSTAGLNLPPGLLEPGVLPEAVASLYAASLIMGTGKPDDIKKAFERLSHAQFMKIPGLKKLFLDKSTRDAAMESMLKTFLGNQKNRHDIAEEMQKAGIMAFLGIKGKGLLSTLGPTGIGMALMMAIMKLDELGKLGVDDVPDQSRGGH